MVTILPRRCFSHDSGSDGAILPAFRWLRSYLFQSHVIRSYYLSPRHTVILSVQTWYSRHLTCSNVFIFTCVLVMQSFYLSPRVTVNLPIPTWYSHLTCSNVIQLSAPRWSHIMRSPHAVQSSRLFKRDTAILPALQVTTVLAVSHVMRSSYLPPRDTSVVPVSYVIKSFYLLPNDYSLTCFIT